MRFDTRRPGGGTKRGAALMMALLVLFILVLIVGQISIGTSTDYRTAKNEVELSSFDLAIESALLKAMEDLRDDLVQEQQQSAPGGDLGGGMGGQSGSETGAANPMSSLPGFGDIIGNAMGGAAGGRVDSRKDLWAQPQRTNDFAPIEMRILIQDESSKYSVLTMLSKDQDEALKAYDRVVRIIDKFREGTSEDVEFFEAQAMADGMRRLLLQRSGSDLARPDLVNYDSEQADLYLPLSLREFLALDIFDPKVFRDYRDDNDLVVHSLTSFLTVHSAIQTRQEMLDQRQAEAGGDEEVDQQEASDLAQATTPTDEESSAAPSSGSSTTGGGSNSNSSGQGSRGGQGSGSQGQNNTQASLALVSAVNLNTAPAAVLKGLFEDRDVPPQFWDEVIRYRNEEAEEDLVAEEEDVDPMLDEFGQPIPDNQIFDTANRLNEFDYWQQLEPIVRSDLKQHVGVKSDVFTIYVTAWLSTSGQKGMATSRQEQERAEQSLGNLRRTVACTVWRRGEGEDAEIIPIVRWEVLDYMPYQILDFPEEGR